jgi:hypothetical protein
VPLRDPELRQSIERANRLLGYRTSFDRWMESEGPRRPPAATPGVDYRALRAENQRRHDAWMNRRGWF